ncbi:MAG: pyrroline-5-carboxylate reductase [Clostridium sp.]|uniref:pyrroline-5-carboxylate reductase n=1 Tax=Clostridium sp. DSM 8431 TaxID=1761781 RepID=UPI0008E70040|nr:pyrroline-5-carboxylate reductase [Clostridium sp. DSM 8431]MCR4944451.1 pyrroline-5-carboxylate reductase [Clostridium sp.]SFU68650.1 pyrroline-5-carboxylate reductase [Clostridium sp. DSM 8431]
MDKVIGFIGSGNMARAMIGGIVTSKLVSADKVIASNPHEEKLNILKEKYGISITTDNKEVASKSDILFLSVKPVMYAKVIEEIKNLVKDDVIIVVIAAGKSINEVHNLFGKDVKIVKTMPNTPALVGEAMSAISPAENITDKELDDIKAIFNSFGKCEVVAENLMDAVTGVSGSSPAYVYMFIEALADAAVLGGMKRDQAYKFAAQSVLGSAKMVLETGLHPGVLKDQVTSPAGTTIEAVAELERLGMRNAVISATTKCIEKSKAMSK